MLTVLTLTLAVFVASHSPKALIAPVIAEFLSWTTFASAAIAFFRGERLLANALTLWDQALVLLWFSLLPLI